MVKIPLPNDYMSYNIGGSGIKTIPDKEILMGRMSSWEVIGDSFIWVSSFVFSHTTNQ